ncbi:hypothetical protein PM082_019284 [Marasmius tenuissimus]|nr:hypothetical protein PM082_019284 [Marasmius tenuissimus]
MLERRADSVQQREEVSTPEILGPLWFFNALQIIGFTLNILIVLIVAVNNRRVRRTALWYMFMSGWVFWCIAYAILFLVGYQGSQKPPTGLCLFQAALIYALPPCMALFTLAILTQLYCAMHSSIKHGRPIQHINAVCTFVPLVAFAGVFIEVLVVGIKDPGTVTRDTTLMYCNTKNSTPAKISSLIVGVASILMLILESVVIITLFNYWNAFVRIREVPGNILSGTMAFRITVFSFMPMIALVLSVVAVLSKNASAISHVAIAFLPTVAAIVFGTQKDVLSAWMFWKTDPAISPNEAVPQASSIGVPPLVRKEVMVSEV